ncbi:competence protein CoiA family protein [Halopiger aswanensis]|uniref:Competence protein CoiA-like protein n=1 Tax=Halopiger aswanensis TaxID=148449 RepID=A0A3R7FSJ1_9EURY|nr:hypothetical protein [Halopiger aswanensis]RKD85218.1 hypothetical protein ATJ93_4720 [Halopiger aswanensis]
MPFVAEHKGARVIPPQVEKGADLVCPKCGGRMKIKDGSVVRHFYHPPEDNECRGESDEHLRMKSIAYSNLTGEFPDADVELCIDEDPALGNPEYPDADVELERGINNRRADIRVEFDSPRFPEGKGIGIEIQYRHEDKDIEAVTVEYLKEEYSVLWLYEDDFDGFDVDLSGVLTVWPYAVLHDFSKGYHEAVQRLQNEKTDSVETRVELPPEYLYRYKPDFKKSWEYGRFLTAESDDSFDFCFEWLSASHSSVQKWIRVAENPDGETVLQLGKDKHGSTEQVISPIELNNRRNRGKVHSLAYSVKESNPASVDDWTDLEKVWLDTGIYGTNLLLKLVAAPNKNRGLYLGKYGDDIEDEFVTVVPDREIDLKSALHNIAEELG